MTEFFKFKSIPEAPDNDLNSGKRVTDLLKSPKNKNKISEGIYNKLRPVYREHFMDLAKKDKPLRNELRLFRPILLVIITRNYKLAKHLVSILSDVIQNEFTIKDSVSFADKILMQNSNLDMTSLGADSLVTKITLNETIETIETNET